jgi:hypothetical protein
MNDFNLSIELAETIGRERQKEAEKHRLLRQVQAGQPGVTSHLGMHIGKLVMALVIALKLR